MDSRQSCLTRSLRVLHWGVSSHNWVSKLVSSSQTIVASLSVKEVLPN
jgi:hypothetical protein